MAFAQGDELSLSLGVGLVMRPWCRRYPGHEESGLDVRERARGGPKDDAQAVSWYRKAAEAGDKFAAENIECIDQINNVCNTRQNEPFCRELTTSEMRLARGAVLCRNQNLTQREVETELPVVCKTSAAWLSVSSIVTVMGALLLHLKHGRHITSPEAAHRTAARWWRNSESPDPVR